jgi:hypothetical protein
MPETVPPPDDAGGIEVLILELTFPIGQLVATPGALEALARSGHSISDFLGLHTVRNWGDLDEDDRASNNYSVDHGGRLLSAYTMRDGERLWIITEADRSSTTLLLPREY